MDLLTKMTKLERRARLQAKFMANENRRAMVSDGPAAKAADPDQLMVQFIATTETVDVDDEVILASGVDPNSYFFSVKSVFLDHDYQLSHLVGKARRIIPRPTLEGVKQWDVHVRLLKDHPYSQLIAELAADGLIGSSIGFAANEMGPPTDDELAQHSKGGRRPVRIIRAWEWIELSVTAIPANQDAMAIGHEPAKQALLEDLVTKGRVDREMAADLGWTGNTSRSLWPVADGPLARKRLVAIVVR